jgi:hypothetical protein
MTIEITEDQRHQIAGILTTHIHNMQAAFIAAHGNDQKRADFYHARFRATELLLPLFAGSEDLSDEEEADDEDDDETK